MTQTNLNSYFLKKLDNKVSEIEKNQKEIEVATVNETSEASTSEKRNNSECGKCENLVSIFFINHFACSPNYIRNQTEYKRTMNEACFFIFFRSPAI